jgi:hypothetical protein
LFKRSYLEKTIHKNVLAEWQDVGPEFKPQYQREKKKKNPGNERGLGAARSAHLFQSVVVKAFCLDSVGTGLR